MTFANAPPAHPFTRPTTPFGGTQWYPAPPKSCPDCDLLGRYNGDVTRIHLGKGMAGERAGRMGLWGAWGNGFWGARNGGWGGGWGQGGYGYGGGGYVPGNIAVEGQGGYDPWTGRFMGGGGGLCCAGPAPVRVKPPKGPPKRLPGQGLLGCLGM
ncbi:uncharacterized protein AB675_5198 [Cyphellophora attinorum]|uniref:Uncharacterized protein n=1 Tax=Cyphellophora attinorum TaxID=1664694 RepID=A0A0N0NLP3_9EURO|nr:uncharacterized protein AB675_5198 [Phialophora attinorum]KPI39269.1 hypothetical protein AB675_5198 [Phialophora attinorum]